jgi:hypothetical protein
MNLNYLKIKQNWQIHWVFKIFGLGPIARPSPPPILTRMIRVWVGQTDPAHSLLAHSSLSFSRAPPVTDVAAACRSRPSLVTSTADTWAYDAPLGPLPPPPSGFGTPRLSDEIGGRSPLGISPAPVASELTPRQISSLCLMCVLAVVQVCVHRRWCCGEVLPG